MRRKGLCFPSLLAIFHTGICLCCSELGGQRSCRGVKWALQAGLGKGSAGQVPRSFMLHKRASRKYGNKRQKERPLCPIP